MRFREDPHHTEPHKEALLSELEAVISRREEELALERRAYCEDILTHGEGHRAAFRDLLGWPLNAALPRPLPACEVIETLGEEGEYTLSRLRLEVMEGFHLTGLLLRCNREGERPLVVASHGGAGTPELISGFYYGGSDVNYNGMVSRLLPYGVHVFMPALLLWDAAFYGQPYDRVALDGRLKRLGGSVTALEVYAITRAMDYLEEALRPTAFGMVGLSYGGMYTLFTAAVETRIRSAVSSSFFSERRDYCWPDWSWKGAAARYDDAEVACLCYPRRLCVEMGTRDELFAAEHTLTAAAAVREYSARAGVDPDSWFHCEVFDGTHEFGRMEEPISRMMGDLFGDASPEGVARPDTQE